MQLSSVRSVVRKVSSFGGVKSASLSTLQKLKWDGNEAIVPILCCANAALLDPLLLTQQLTDDENIIHVCGDVFA